MCWTCVTGVQERAQEGCVPDTSSGSLSCQDFLVGACNFPQHRYAVAVRLEQKD